MNFPRLSDWILLALLALAGLAVCGCKPAAGSIDDTDPGAGLAVGAEVPNFALTDHGGREFELAELRPQAVLVTFIFTRCPSMEFCPMMSQKFAETRAALDQSPWRDEIVLLSVTLDPEHDTVEVLADYAGHFGARPGDWTFATSTPAVLEEMKAAFGVTAAFSEETGTIEHNLVTALIDSSGRLGKVWLGNQWEIAKLVAELPAATGEKPARPTEAGS